MIRAMVETQLRTGMRPGEVIQLRGVDLDMSGPVWEFRPRNHKTEHVGRDRVIFIGPRAQGVIRSWLRGDPDEFLFGPRQNREYRLKGRPTPRPHTKQGKRHRKRRLLGDRYTLVGYENAIRRACQKAGVPRWGPNRLRHLTATVVRSKYGLEAARTVLGHADAAVTWFMRSETSLVAVGKRVPMFGTSS